jgi:hypothetical protein
MQSGDRPHMNWHLLSNDVLHHKLGTVCCLQAGPKALGIQGQEAGQRHTRGPDLPAQLLQACMQIRLDCCRRWWHSLLIEANPSSSTAPALHPAEVFID